MKLSIVSTLYLSGIYVDEFHSRASRVAKDVAEDDYEIILVNDGSPDDSLERAVSLTTMDDHLVIVDLSRNFGHHKSMMTGLAHASGDLVLLIDSDLEEDPECLPEFANEMSKSSCDVVYGVQVSRKGGWGERWFGQIFYSVFRLLTGLQLPENVLTARLMTRRYVDALLLHQEREVFLAGLWHITGFEQVPLMMRKRSLSKTTYTFRHKLSMLVNSVTSFSNAPLVSIFYIGVAISLLASFYVAFLIANWIFLAKPVSGWTSVMASIWLIGGLVISFIGVVGIYLSKIFSETKRRPYTIVRQVYGKQRS